MLSSQTATMNSMGIALLSQAYTPEALKMFQSALSCARNKLMASDHPHASSNIKVGVSLRSVPLENNKSAVEGLRFYNGAFTMDGLTDDATADYVAPEFSAAILFNLGLLYHRHGMATGSSKSLIKALRIYDFSLSALFGQESAIHNSVVTAVDMTLLELALYSNIAHVNTQFFNEEETIRSQSLLRSKLATVNPSQLSESDYEFFYLNVIMAQNQQFSFAPAA
jgi:hypothetical protein